jgi:hypothetical protein
MMHEAQAAMKGIWRAACLPQEKWCKDCEEEASQITQGAWTWTRPSLFQKTRKLVCKNQELCG